MVSADQSFYITGGTLPFDASSYVERQADKDLLDGLLRRNEFCYVLNTRQMGKSSLMIRTAKRLSEEGVVVAVLDLAAIGQNLTPEQWYDGLLISLSEQLSCEDELCDFWDSHSNLGPMQRFFAAIGQVALPYLKERRLVLFVDEIDAVRSLPFPADEFFAGIRECYNRRAQNPVFQRLSVCLLGVATPADLISDTRISPFNVGRRIVITDFTPDEAAPLAQGMAGGKTVLARVLYWTGGHPYMTQRLCRAVAEAQPPLLTAGRVDTLCERLFLTKQAQDSDDNLAFVRNRLLRSEVDLASLLDLYNQVRTGKKIKDDETNPLTGVLRLSGVATADQAGYLRVRNRIYDHVFDRDWVLAHMPDAELRRQRAAYRAGMLRVGGIGGAVATALATLAIIALGNAQLARESVHEKEQSRLAAVASARTAERERENAERAREDADRNANLARESAKRERNSAVKATKSERQTRLALIASDRANKLAQRAKADAVARAREAQAARGDAEAAKDQALRQAGATKAALGKLTVALNNARTERQRADTESSRARSAATKAQLLTYLAQMSVAQREWEANRPADVQEALHKAEVMRDDKGFEWGFWNRALHGEEMTLREVSGVRRVSPSPDGTYLVTTHYDGTPPAVWDLRTGRRRHTLTGQVAAISPDGKTIATIGANNQMRLWDAATGLSTKEIAGQNVDVRALAFAPDGARVAVAEGQSVVRVWSVRTGQVTAVLRGDRLAVQTVAFSPDGQTLVTGGEDRVVRLWNSITGQLRHTLAPAHESRVTDVAFSPDGKRVASASADGTVKIWGELEKSPPALIGTLRRTYEAVEGSRAQEATSAYLATLDERARGHLGVVSSVAFSPDGKRLVTGGSYDNTARVWNADTGREVQVFAGHTASVLSVAFLPDGERIVTGDGEGVIRCWNTSEGPGHVSRLSAGAAKAANALAFSPDGRWLVTAHGNGSARVWDARTRRELRRLDGHQGAVHCVIVSDDGKRIATGDDKVARLWDAQTGQLLNTFISHEGHVRSLVFLDSGSRLAAGCGTSPALGSVKRYVVWDVATGRRERLGDGVTNIAAMPGGAEYLTGGHLTGGSFIQMWNAPDARKTQTYQLPGGYVSTIAVSPDGKQVAATGRDDAIHFLDAVTGKRFFPPV